MIQQDIRGTGSVVLLCFWITGFLDSFTVPSNITLALPVPWISESCIEIKIKGLYETFWDTTKKCENKNLT